MLQIILYILLGAAVTAVAVFSFIRLGRMEEARNPRLAEEKMVLRCGDESLIKLYLAARNDAERSEIAGFARQALGKAEAEAKAAAALPEAERLPPLSDAELAEFAAAEADAAYAGEAAYIAGRADDAEEQSLEQALAAAVRRLEGRDAAAQRLASLFEEPPAPAAFAAPDAAAAEAAALSAQVLAEMQAEAEAEQAPASGLKGRLRSWLRPAAAEAESGQAPPVTTQAEVEKTATAAPLAAAAEESGAGLPPADIGAQFFNLAQQAAAAQPETGPDTAQPTEAPICRFCGSEVEPPDCKFCIICGMPVTPEPLGRSAAAGQSTAQPGVEPQAGPAESGPQAEIITERADIAAQPEMAAEAGSVAIIGNADGPTAVYLKPRPAPESAAETESEAQAEPEIAAQEEISAETEYTPQQQAEYTVAEAETEEAAMAEESGGDGEAESAQSLAYSVQEILASVRDLEQRIMQEADLNLEDLYARRKNQEQ